MFELELVEIASERELCDSVGKGPDGRTPPNPE
jgi:hypothetical protein